MAANIKPKRFRWTVEKLKLQGFDKYGNLYDYNKVIDPITLDTHVTILCNKCNKDFEQTVRSHIKSTSGCPNCTKYAKYTFDNFLKKVALVYEENLYDYSIVAVMGEFNSKSMIDVACNVCGYIFNVKAGTHVNNKSGCPKCAHRLPYTYDLFIENAKEKHGYNYNYSLVTVDSVTGASAIVKIICNACDNVFDQRITSHVNDGNGCPRCAGNEKYTYELFIKKAQDKHQDKYDYSLINKDIKLSTSTFIHIICNRCKITFERSVASHIHHQSGCPRCNKSLGELKVEKYLVENGFNFESEYTFPSLPRKRYDFALHDKKIVIEYDGLQHFAYTKYFFKTLDLFEKRKQVDVQKSIEAVKNGYTIIRISYDNKNIDEYLNFAINNYGSIHLSSRELYTKHIEEVLQRINIDKDKIILN
jgi:formylmethanofuran dehydrogenase subunit E